MTASSTWFTRLALIPGLAVAMVLASLTLASPAQARTIRSDFFGMHDTQIANGSVPTVKLGSVRLWDSGTSWREIETAPAVYDWSTVDSAVNNAHNAGLRPMLVLGQTPQFWAEKPMAPGAYGDGASSMPNIDAWKRYVTTAAERYGNKVDYQIWNEPSVINFWTGTVTQMARLTATASKAITNAAGRKATVVAPSFPLRLGSQQKWYRKYWAATVNRKGMASFVDVVSANLYPLTDQGPEASMQLLRYAKRVLPKGARGKPIWNTEINYGLVSGGAMTTRKITAARQAAFVARTLLLNAGSPIRRVYWYAWNAGSFANTHLAEDDQTTLTQGGRAWQEVHGWLVGTDVKGCSKTSRGKLKGLYTCTARESRREVRRFYWKPSGPAAKVATHRSTRSWTDLTGDTTRRTGRFGIKVGQSPIMVTSRR